MDDPYKLCSHDELKWGRKKEIIGGKEIVVCGRCREEMPAIHTQPQWPGIWPKCTCGGVAVTNASGDITRTCIRCGKIVKASDPAKKSLVDLYEMKDGQYVKTVSDMPFQKFLEDDLKIQLIPVSNADQLKYGINFVSVAAKKILAIDGVSSAYKERLAAEGVNATWMNFSNLTGGYGAAHCTTQVIRRE